jgi:hypothetical protein
MPKLIIDLPDNFSKEMSDILITKGRTMVRLGQAINSKHARIGKLAALAFDLGLKIQIEFDKSTTVDIGVSHENTDSKRSV